MANLANARYAADVGDHVVGGPPLGLVEEQQPVQSDGEVHSYILTEQGNYCNIDKSHKIVYIDYIQQLNIHKEISVKTRIVLLALVAAALLSGCATQIYVQGGTTHVKVRRPIAKTYDTLYVEHYWEDYPGADIEIHCTMGTIGAVVLERIGDKVAFELPVGDVVTFWFQYQNPINFQFYHGQVKYKVPAPGREFHGWYIDRDFVRRHIRSRGEWKYGF